MQFDAYSHYYDLLYKDKDYAGESHYVLKLLDSYSPHCKSILELGCGTGKHASLIAELERFVTGIEISPLMLAQAISRSQNCRAKNIGGSFTAFSGDARTTRLNKTFDAVISLFHVVSYQITNEDAQKIFETAAVHLKPGGIFLFDVWYGPAVLHSRPETRIKRMENQEYSILRIAEPTLDVNSNRVDVHYTVQVTEKSTGRFEQLAEQHRMRYFFKPELEILAQNLSLQIIHAEEWMTRATPSDRTWGVTFITRKN